MRVSCHNSMHYNMMNLLVISFTLSLERYRSKKLDTFVRATTNVEAKEDNKNIPQQPSCTFPPFYEDALDIS